MKFCSKHHQEHDIVLQPTLGILHLSVSNQGEPMKLSQDLCWKTPQGRATEAPIFCEQVAEGFIAKPIEV